MGLWNSLGAVENLGEGDPGEMQGISNLKFEISD